MIGRPLGMLVAFRAVAFCRKTSGSDGGVGGMTASPADHDIDSHGISDDYSAIGTPCVVLPIIMRKPHLKTTASTLYKRIDLLLENLIGHNSHLFDC